MPRNSGVVVNHHTLSRPRTTKRTGRRSLPSTMLRPQIHLLIWTRRAAEAEAPRSRFSEARRRRTNTRYTYTHIRTSFRPFLGSTAKRLGENRNRRIRIPLPLFLMDRVAVMSVPAARKVCTPEGPVIRMGKGIHRTTPSLPPTTRSPELCSGLRQKKARGTKNRNEVRALIRLALEFGSMVTPK